VIFVAGESGEGAGISFKLGWSPRKKDLPPHPAPLATPAAGGVSSREDVAISLLGRLSGG
jgi:hypothetical protein